MGIVPFPSASPSPPAYERAVAKARTRDEPRSHLIILPLFVYEGDAPRKKYHRCPGMRSSRSRRRQRVLEAPRSASAASSCSAFPTPRTKRHPGPTTTTGSCSMRCARSSRTPNCSSSPTSATASTPATATAAKIVGRRCRQRRDARMAGRAAVSHAGPAPTSSRLPT